MFKYLCSLEPRYIIFSYGKQLICISKRTQLWWYIQECPGEHLLKYLALNSPTQQCWALASQWALASLVLQPEAWPHTPVTRCSDTAKTESNWKQLPGLNTKNLWGRRSQQKLLEIPKACGSLSFVFLNFTLMHRCLWGLSPELWLPYCQMNENLQWEVYWYMHYIIQSCLQEGSRPIESHEEII